ncbi:Hypothetical predicted protein [Octopus vulgaris]|uniref:DUF4817 domain-containing protein n=1 Tax=Octopus vulgaris TaxID=6645 RepID=A0AA36B535_OCTVU|nr:Hypothetical predicted protein [Octopus vulgaris]
MNESGLLSSTGKQSTGKQNAEMARPEWTEEYQKLAPSRLTVYNIRDKFERTGSICTAQKSGRPVPVIPEENEIKEEKKEQFIVRKLIMKLMKVVRVSMCDCKIVKKEEKKEVKEKVKEKNENEGERDEE